VPHVINDFYIKDFAITMDPESDNPLPISKDSNTNSQNKTDLSGLSNDELLNQLANSPCANRIIPDEQSLEDYLRKSQAKVARRSPP